MTSKRVLSAILAAMLAASPCLASDGFVPYPVVGRWQPSEAPILIDQYGFQDIQNLRKDGKRLRGVSGHSRLTVNPVDSSYTYIKNGFHFSKDSPAESHVLVDAQTSVGNGRVFRSSQTVPIPADFSASYPWTDATGANIGRFAAWPGGNLAYANGDDTCVWSGLYGRIGAAITSTATPTSPVITNPKDRSEMLSSQSQDSDSRVTISLAADKVLLVGSFTPLQGVKFYSYSANASAAQLSVKEWQSGGWTALTEVDGTNGLAMTGSVTWTATGSAMHRYIEGYDLYWYAFEISAGSAAVYYVTVDSAFQAVPNVWDLEEEAVASFRVWDGATYKDYTDQVQDDTYTTVAELDGLTGNTHAFYCGFANPQQGVHLYIPGGKGNSSVASVSAYYWSGTAWVACSEVADGTLEGTKCLAQSGVISWNPVPYGTEVERQIAGELPMYFYMITWTNAVALDAETEIYHVKGIPNPRPVEDYGFPVTFAGRAWLFDEADGHRNKGIYSAYNLPHCWDGIESGEVYVGDESRVIAAAPLYNVYLSSGIEQLIVAKRNSTHRITVSESDDVAFDVKEISPVVGCVAPLSMVTCKIAGVGEGVDRQVVAFASDAGIEVCDGANVKSISQDVRCYWDQQDARCLTSAEKALTVMAFDPNLQALKVLLGDGTELEYSFAYNEWTKLYREDYDGANPLRCIFPARDTNGTVYLYGGNDDGHLYRTEHGTSWDGEGIDQYVQTKDFSADENYLLHSTIDYIRVLFEDRTANTLDYLMLDATDYLLTSGTDKLILSDAEVLSVDHYCDSSSTATVDGTDDQAAFADVSLGSGPFATQDVALGPCLAHSVKISTETTGITDGLELHGLGFVTDTMTTIRSDE